MVTLGERMAHAIGQALVPAAIAFPVTYMVLRKRFNLVIRIGALWPFGASWLALALLGFFREYVGFDLGASDFDIWIEVMLTMTFPMIVSAIAIYAWHAAASAQQNAGMSMIDPRSAPVGKTAPTTPVSGRVNWRRGLSRAWLFGSAIWCVYVFAAGQVAGKLMYAYRYHTDYSDLMAQVNPDPAAAHATWIAKCIDEKKRAAVADEAWRATKDADAPKFLRDQKALAATDADFSVAFDCAPSSDPAIARPGPPDWTWLLAMFVPPTVGMLVVGVSLWTASRIGRWLWRGFTP